MFFKNKWLMVLCKQFLIDEDHRNLLISYLIIFSVVNLIVIIKLVANFFPPALPDGLSQES